MINPVELEAQIMADIRRTSGLHPKRSYLGLSNVVDKCQVKTYRSYVEGPDLSDYHHRMCAVGYLYEKNVMDRLVRMGIASRKSREVVSDFDKRLRGHVDGETKWGDLLEVKSVTAHKFEIVCKLERALREHYDQVQLYMRYGGWKQAWIIYVNRETYEHKVILCPYNAEIAEKLVTKAQAILGSIDEGHAPNCQCGRCGSTDFEADTLTGTGKRTGTNKQ